MPSEPLTPRVGCLGFPDRSPATTASAEKRPRPRRSATEAGRQDCLVACSRREAGRSSPARLLETHPLGGVTRPARPSLKRCHLPRVPLAALMHRAFALGFESGAVAGDPPYRGLSIVHHQARDLRLRRRPRRRCHPRHLGRHLRPPDRCREAPVTARCDSQPARSLVDEPQSLTGPRISDLPFARVHLSSSRRIYFGTRSSGNRLPVGQLLGNLIRLLTELAESSGLSPSTMAELIDNLEALEYERVRRLQDIARCSRRAR